jgi:hypothetical protein
VLFALYEIGLFLPGGWWVEVGIEAFDRLEGLVELAMKLW